MRGHAGFGLWREIGNCNVSIRCEPRECANSDFRDRKCYLASEASGRHALTGGRMAMTTKRGTFEMPITCHMGSAAPVPVG